MPITNREFLENVDPSTLKDYPWNATLHDQVGINLSISEYGYCDVITVDENDEILSGHGRKAYFIDAEKPIPVVQKVYGLTEEEKRGLRLAVNKLNKNSGQDLNKVKTEINYLAQLGFNLRLTGYSEAELASLIDKTSAAVSESASAIMEKYSDSFSSVPVRESKPDMFARDDYVPDYPIDAPKILIERGPDRESDPLPEERSDPDSGLSFMIMLTFKAQAEAEKFLESIGRTEKFSPGRRQIHIDMSGIS